MSTLSAPYLEGNHTPFNTRGGMPDESVIFPGTHTPEEIQSMVEGLEAYRIDMACQTADEAHAAALAMERQRLIALLGTPEVRICRDLMVTEVGTMVRYFVHARGCNGMGMTIEEASDNLQVELSKARAVAVA